MTTPLDSAIPVLRVGDYRETRDFYVQKLGFTIAEEAGDPEPGFAILHRGRAEIFLNSWQGADARTHDGWRAYFHVADMSALLAEFEAAGVAIAHGPHDTSYGLREVEIDDPSGNRLCFGQILGDC